MESAHSATYQQRAHEHLYALRQSLNRYDEITAELRDDVLHITYATGTGEDRHEKLTCRPRPSDGDRLWVWDSERAPLAEAGDPSATLAVVARLREGLTPPWRRQ